MLSGGHLQQTSGEKENWLNKVWSAMMSSQQSPPETSYQAQRALHATTTKVVNVQHQVERLQSHYNLEMTRLAQAYQTLSKEERTQLPQKLRSQLDRIEAEYF